MNVDDRRRGARRSPSTAPSPPRRSGRGSYDYDRKPRLVSPTRKRDDPASSRSNKYGNRTVRDRSPPPHMTHGRLRDSGPRHEEKEKPSGWQRSPSRYDKDRRDDAGRDNRYNRK